MMCNLEWVSDEWSGVKDEWSALSDRWLVASDECAGVSAEWSVDTHVSLQLTGQQTQYSSDRPSVCKVYSPITIAYLSLIINHSKRSTNHSLKVTYDSRPGPHDYIAFHSIQISLPRQRSVITDYGLVTPPWRALVQSVITHDSFIGNTTFIGYDSQFSSD